MNTRPPRVTIGPPYCSVPVIGIPRAESAANSPSGIRQRYSPVFRSIALSVPHGGLMAGKPLESRQAWLAEEIHDDPAFLVLGQLRKGRHKATTMREQLLQLLHRLTRIETDQRRRTIATATVGTVATRT